MAKKSKTTMDDRIPSVASYARKIENTYATMYATNYDDRSSLIPLRIQEMTVHGEISNCQKPADLAGDPTKLNPKLGVANIQTIDSCCLPENTDTLCVKFGINFYGNVGQPCSINNEEFKDTVKKGVSEYFAKTGGKELAYRYAYNLAAARFLWRNRLGAKAIEVIIRADDGTTFVFNAYDFPLFEFEKKPELEPLAEKIAEALSSEDDGAFLSFDVSAFAKHQPNAPVFPSEEFVPNKDKNDKSRVLYQNMNGIASMHYQKIGNALRTIDTWYDEFPKYQSPISVESFGSVSQQNLVLRKPSDGKDFYTLFYKFGLGEPIGENEEHYVIAMLIRGGVFGKVKEKKAKE